MRTFAINEGHMNQLLPESIPEEIFEKASALVVSSYEVAPEHIIVVRVEDARDETVLPL